MAWKITWRGQSWTDDDLTGQHLGTLALISGDDSFQSLDLSDDFFATYPQQGYMRLMNMVAAFVAVEVTEGKNNTEAATALTEALEEIQKASADEILGAITFDA